jgi:hypothetical protein
MTGSLATCCSSLGSQLSRSSAGTGFYVAGARCESGNLLPIQTIQNFGKGYGEFGKIDGLQAVPVGLKRRISFRENGAKNAHVILRPHPILKLGELDRHLPADVFPVLAGCSELLRSRAFPTVGLSNADRDNPGVHEREDQAAGRDLAHGFIERIPRAVRVALGRPKITVLEPVAVCLVLVDPPTAHKARRPMRPYHRQKLMPARRGTLSGAAAHMVRFAAGCRWRRRCRSRSSEPEM